MSFERLYTSRRQAITNALVDVLKQIDGKGDFSTNLYENVHPYLKFWDEVTDFPSVHISTGSESREYQGGGYKDRFLTLTIRCYVNEEYAQDALSGLLEDIETLLEINSSLEYKDRNGQLNNAQQITIVSIDTDEGVLEPLGVGEMTIEVRY